MADSFKHIAHLSIGDRSIKMVSFQKLQEHYHLDRLPYAIKILLENLLRHEAQPFVSPDDITRLAQWDVTDRSAQEIAFVPARVILQDFTGVPAIVDLAAMRDAVNQLGGDAQSINPFCPVELVIDHSVMVDNFASKDALQLNTHIEFERNKERYQFLKWGQQAFDNFKVVPPGRGIVHQVNLEYLARCVFDAEIDGEAWAYPDTLVGTDSHTTMINGLGVLGWGVGGIEAEAAMLQQPVTMLIPEVVGFELSGELNPGVTATDLVLTITERLREHGVVGKFVEFYGPGLQHLSTADRATIANMSPEYGATCGIFPLDSETMRYLRLTGRHDAQLELVKTYAQALGLWHTESTPPACYHEVITFDLNKVEPSIAGPKRPQDRVALSDASDKFNEWLEQRVCLIEQPEQEAFVAEGGPPTATDCAVQTGAEVTYRDQQFELMPGAVVIAAITSCTNTSNPAVLIAAGLLAKRAREKGLTTPPWVKTSLAPGSQVVTQYLTQAGLLEPLESLGFSVVGYGCTTCIGNSGPLPKPIETAIRNAKIPVCSVLSGNRNFEGRIHPDVVANYLASPPLVVAYALAGNLRTDLSRDPLGYDRQNQPVYLRDLWPSEAEIKQLTDQYVAEKLFLDTYADIYCGEAEWKALEVPKGDNYYWPESSYIKAPPFFNGMDHDVPAPKAIDRARCLVKVGDSITTDHISPAGAIALDSPAGRYLRELGIAAKDFNSYGSRRGNHEVMMRGTFANVRLKNQLAPGTEGSATTHFPSQERLSIFAAACRYQADGVPTLVIAGKEYGTGSSRDWAAKGPSLLGVRAVLAESYERIHRSNLIGMGILPLQFKAGESAAQHNLKGDELFSIGVIDRDDKKVTVKVTDSDGRNERSIEMIVRIDTPNEFEYYRHGGILQYVIRKGLENR